MLRFHPIECLAAAIVVLATAALTALGQRQLALGLGVGGLLAIANFFALRTLMGAIAAAEHPPRQAMLSILLMLKFAVMGGVIFALINVTAIDPGGMLLGLSIVVVSILVHGFRLALRGGPAAQE